MRRFSGTSWTLDDLRDALAVCEDLAAERLGLDLYPNRVEIVDQTEMFRILAFHGLPYLYHHWSFGKRAEEHRRAWRSGRSGQVFELVINSDPCINWLLDTNTLATQIAVLAHAAVGHNAFFRNNLIIRENTRPDFVVDWLDFARRYVADCEQRYGEEAVERLLDDCHTLGLLGVSHTPRRHRSRQEQEARRRRERELREHGRHAFWDPVVDLARPVEDTEDSPEEPVQLDDENVLYHVEKAGRLEEWQREIVRIVRVLNEYFRPNILTRLINEGFATWTHHDLMWTLREREVVDDGIFQEFLDLHSSVIWHPDWRRQRGAITHDSVYAFGFDLLREVVRVAEEPTEEDARVLPAVAGIGRKAALAELVTHHTSESAIWQFLTPRLVREWKLFAVHDEAEAEEMVVTAIHDEAGFTEIRRHLADSCAWHALVPDIRVREAGEGTLKLVHQVHRGRRLDRQSTPVILRALGRLWGRGVELTAVDAEHDRPFERWTVEDGRVTYTETK